MHGMNYDVKMPGLWSITLNYNSDWSGEVFVSWLDVEPPFELQTWSFGQQDTWLSEHQTQIQVDGKALLRGRAQPMPSDQGGISKVTVPFTVLTIATWLAVNNWWQRHMINFAEDAYAGGYR